MDPIDLLYGGLDKLGPGADTDTRHVLRQLPRQRFEVVVDAGCGTGRQTLVLARELGAPIHAIDSHEPFLARLRERARAAGLGHLVQTRCMDMSEIPHVFPRVDLLWSEGAAYTIGFASALATWAPAIDADGFVVVSELSWVRPQAPTAVREFFRTGYPDMRSVEQNLAVVERAGYRSIATHRIPGEAWIDGYYDVLEPRAKALVEHADAAVRHMATETIEEIEIFRQSAGSYAYVFYVLAKAT